MFDANPENVADMEAIVTMNHFCREENREYGGFKGAIGLTWVSSPSVFGFRGWRSDLVFVPRGSHSGGAALRVDCDMIFASDRLRLPWPSACEARFVSGIVK